MYDARGRESFLESIDESKIDEKKKSSSAISRLVIAKFVWSIDHRALDHWIDEDREEGEGNGIEISRWPSLTGIR